MRRRFSALVGLSLGIVLSLALAFNAVAQEKAKGKASKEDRLSGRIQMINKDTKTITLDTKGNVKRQVVYSDSTKITYRNKPSSMDEVKEGRRVICLGKFNDKTQLEATRIDVREGK